jgi:hypothetical protein
MNDAKQPAVQASPNGAALFILGLLSLLFGPFTAIPGLIISKKFRPFSGTAAVGYFPCWFALVMVVGMCITLAIFMHGHR